MATPNSSSAAAAAAAVDEPQSPPAAAPTFPTSIRYAEEQPPRRSESDFTAKPPTRTDSGMPGGIYHSRTIDVNRRRSFSRVPSSRRRRRAGGGSDAESNAESDAEEWLRDGGKKKQIFRGRALLWLAYQSIGVIYGDIGTSPLYVFSSTFTSAPSSDDLVQILSIVIWSITLVVTVKYVLIILLADNEGEGGTFSCYSLLTRYANITDRDPREQATIHIQRHLTSDLGPGTQRLRVTLERSKFFKNLLKTIGVLAVSMVMSDGVLTPAQSILGAVQGLSVVKPDISQPTIIGTTCGIIVVLFLIQPLGTSVLASAFAPIVILWLGFNGGFGIYNLVRFDWTVLRAFSPVFAFRFFIEHKTEGWKMLGGVLLAFTGVEALFADLGAFSLGAIRLSWLCYTFPCLLLAYIGQAAYISVHPDAYSNPFFNSAPPGMLYPSLVLAVLAAIVASQAIITATFQLVSQIMKLSFSPQVKVVHTSRIFHGQLYVPFLNWLLMIGAVAVTAIFRDTTRLGNAYGVCVMFVTFFDTMMVTLVALIVWRLSPYLVFLPWLTFAALDGLYLSSALIKVPEGAWITLLVSGILAALFLLWRFGKENQWRAEAQDRFHPRTLLTTAPPSALSLGAGGGAPPRISMAISTDGRLDSSMGEKSGLTSSNAGLPLRLTDRWGGDSVSTIRGLGIFFDKTGVMTPTVFTQFVTKFLVMPEVTVFFHLHPIETPTVVDGTDRYLVARIREIPGCYRLVVRHGYMDEVISPDLAALIYEQVRGFVTSGRGAPHDDEGPGRGRDSLASPPPPPVMLATSSGVSVPQNNNDEALSPVALSEVAEEPDSPKEKEKTASGAGGGDHQQQQPQLRHRLSRQQSERGRPESTNFAADELARLDKAYGAKAMYIVGKEQMRIREGTGWARTALLGTFLWIRENTRAKIANLRLAMERVVEVGFVKDI